MVILTSSETNNHSNNVDFVTKIIHLRSEWHDFIFLLKKLDFRERKKKQIDKSINLVYNFNCKEYDNVRLLRSEMVPDTPERVPEM